MLTAWFEQAAEGQCIGPEIRIDATPDATTNTIASKNGRSWLTPWAGFGWTRSIVVGMVMVVMVGVSLPEIRLSSGCHPIDEVALM
jgi:hypothetical protein